MSEKNTETKKLTYEQLEQAANQLLAQNNELKQAFFEMSNAMKRLDYLFKVLDHVHLFDTEFADKCVTEIVTMMTLPEKVEVSTEAPNDVIAE
jgi:hypothetical protein